MNPIERNYSVPSTLPSVLPGVPSSASAAPSGFGGLFHSAAQQIQALDGKAQASVLGVLNGSGTEVHEAVIATQRADLALQLALQVRNKAVAAYQQMMQMQF